jgi:CSLREA domain-containing protein
MTDKIRTVLGTIIFPIITIAILMAVILIYVPQIFSSNGVLVVNSTADTNDGNCNAANCTLREAITAANNSPGEDSINFSLPANATITLNGNQLPIISGTLTIDGSTAVNLTINGDNESRVFVIDEAPPPYPRPGKSDRVGGIVTINDLTIINGNDDYGGTISNSGNLVLVDNILSDGNAIYGNI